MKKAPAALWNTCWNMFFGIMKKNKYEKILNNEGEETGFILEYCPKYAKDDQQALHISFIRKNNRERITERGRMMKKVCVMGHFGFGKDMLNGQTVKTKIVTTELERQLGADQVMKIDTHGGARILPKVVFQLLQAFRRCRNVIILPAHNGIRIFVPLCVAVHRIYHRNLHYVVIGGWLPEFLKNRKSLSKALKKFDGIYVETNTMKKALEEQGFANVYEMPNFKDLHILKESELVYHHTEPYPLCTFSRVMKEKGIEDAVNAVKRVNEQCGRTVYTLDIYGQVDPSQTEWFENLKNQFPSYIRYGGLVPFDQSVEVLKNYYALLFPTYYDGEGFAGTLLDAMAAGVPVIASDWKYNREIVNEKNGVLFETQNVHNLTEKMMSMQNTHLLKRYCLQEAKKYRPEATIQVLMDRL